jgi:hypothetical protein
LRGLDNGSGSGGNLLITKNRGIRRILNGD